MSKTNTAEVPLTTALIADYHAAIRDTGLDPDSRDDMLAINGYANTKSIHAHRQNIARYLRMLGYELSEIGSLIGRDRTTVSDMVRAPMIPENDRWMRVAYEQIEMVVLDCVGTTRDELRGNGRAPLAVVARGVIAYLCRMLTYMSYPEIARALNRPSHTSVIAAVQRTHERVRSPHDIAICHGMKMKVMVDFLANKLRARRTEAA